MPFSGYDNFAACVADQKAKGKSDEAARKICGALQARVEKGAEMSTDVIDVAKKLGEHLVEKSLSHDDVRHKLQKAVGDSPSLVADASTHVWVSDVYDTYFIYEKDEKFYRRDYSVSDGEVTLGMDGPVEVERVVEYKPVEG